MPKSIHPSVFVVYRNAGVSYIYRRSPITLSQATSDLESEPSHAELVLVYCRLAGLLGIGGGREEHALVALGLFVLAYAAGLFGCLVSGYGVGDLGCCSAHLGLRGGVGLSRCSGSAGAEGRWNWSAGIVANGLLDCGEVEEVLTH